MADRPISSLDELVVTTGSELYDTSMFVLEQSDKAMKLKGSSLKKYLNTATGVTDVSYKSSSSTYDTYEITYNVDNQKSTFNIPYGRDETITRIDISYAGSTSKTSTPASDYWKNTVAEAITYFETHQNVSIKGNYIWTKTVINFSIGNPNTSYDISYQGLDGNGTVNSVNNVAPTGGGTNVSITGADIPTSSSDTVKLDKACKTYIVTISNLTTSSSSITYTYPTSGTDLNITNDMVCINSILTNSNAQDGDWTITTSNGSLTISGAFKENETTSITLYLMKKR